MIPFSIVLAQSHSCIIWFPCIIPLLLSFWPSVPQRCLHFIHFCIWSHQCQTQLFAPFTTISRKEWGKRPEFSAMELMQWACKHSLDLLFYLYTLLESVEALRIQKSLSPTEQTLILLLLQTHLPTYIIWRGKIVSDYSKYGFLLIVPEPVGISLEGKGCPVFT